MIKPFQSFLYGVILFLNISLKAQPVYTPEKRIDSLFSRYTSQTPGVAVAIVKDGKIVFEKGYGMADLENDVPITPQTVFHVASVSKQFTAFSIYLLENEGKISFEDDIRKYIPELPDYGTPIKIKHLLAHTSGLRDQWSILTLAGWRFDDVITTEQILKLVSNQKNLNFEPGGQYNYCNTGYTLLAEIVHRVTGLSFSDFTKKNIFEPLGMSSTQFYEDFQKIVKRRANSYEKTDNVYYHKRLNYSNVGATSLMTTVEDLSKWVLNFENPKVGNARLIQSFNEPSYLNNGKKAVSNIIDGDTLYHAKGQLIRDYRGVRIFKHGGHDAGFRAFLGRFPEKHFAIITLSNDEHYEIFKTGLEIAGFYLKNDLQEKKTSTLPPASTDKPVADFHSSLKDFEGIYHSEELTTDYQVKVKGEKLVMQHRRLSDIELTRTGENKFSGVNTFSFEIEFLKKKGGSIGSFEISNFGAKKVKFEKVN